jgi:hypothetical protein
MAARSGKVRVLIPTLDGPVEVMRLVEEDERLGRSVLCLDGSTQTVVVSSDYDAFVGTPTGIVERLYDHRCYRLDVSGKIDAGSSWQLGVLAAHALHAVDRLAQSGEPAETVMMATGTVHTADMTVGPVTHVGRKLGLASQCLVEASKQGTRTVVAYPKVNAEDISSRQRAELEEAGVQLFNIGEFSQLTDRLELRRPVSSARHLHPAEERALNSASAPPFAGLSFYRPIGVLCAVFLVLLIAAYLGYRTERLPWQYAGTPTNIFDGEWRAQAVVNEFCPLRSDRQWLIRISQSAIEPSLPEKGAVNPDGEIHFTLPARANPMLTIYFWGRLVGGEGDGVHETRGTRCAGTFTMKREG